MTLKTLSDVRIIELARHRQNGGDLVAFEERSGLPFLVSRIFTVRAAHNSVRGQHAHQECSQVFTCPSGVVEVECDDGRAKAKFVLDRFDRALFVPASIWATQTYRGDGSLLTVLCDQPYDEADYIRDYAAFLVWRQGFLAP